MLLRKLLGAQGYKTVKKGIWGDHPIFAAGLGICSALAVSNKVENAVAMGAGVTFVLVATAVIVSSLRSLIPQRVRIITYMITIASFVIIVDKFLQAFFPGISEAVGPYVGLIITNCIIMGRAEAFFIQNNAYQSVLDAISNGFAYSYTLIAIAVVREVLGFGTLLGISIMPNSYEKWVVMTMAPGAFFLLGLAIWISKTLSEPKIED
ncbi:MAG: Rnf-Nqr domain containing protein [Planctomycetota bacterium]|jgi:Na+-transporting NADH:ubiquinone oxidoreductase subunit D